MMLEPLDIHIQKKKKNVNIDFAPFTKNQSKCIANLNVKYKIIKLLEDILGENLDDFVFDHGILDVIP